MLKRFELKDIVFIAIFSAALLMLSGLIVPLVMFTRLFALRQLLSAPFFALFGVIAIVKTRKPGTLLLMGIFTGLVLLFMSPVMFYNNVFGAILAEVIGLAAGGYEKKRAVILAAGLYIPLTLPITLVFTAWLKGISFAEQWGTSWVSPLICCGTILTGMIGAVLGWKLAIELQKSGKLR
ncbi:MAG: MptD family putative ECF transporter S component [Lachnospiraceae bacterium]|nr:MptD family putative ECF transporter S component [Lachnospiraceae bacterium]MDY5742228.1 MptD family putative ECF transporter S component [Lachnospiraceae bacterium]